MLNVNVNLSIFKCMFWTLIFEIMLSKLSPEAKVWRLHTLKCCLSVCPSVTTYSAMFSEMAGRIGLKFGGGMGEVGQSVPNEKKFEKNNFENLKNWKLKNWRKKVCFFQNFRWCICNLGNFPGGTYTWINSLLSRNAKLDLYGSNSDSNRCKFKLFVTPNWER